MGHLARKLIEADPPSAAAGGAGAVETVHQTVYNIFYLSLDLQTNDNMTQKPRFPSGACWVTAPLKRDNS